MNGENARSSAEARASNASSLAPEAALAMAGFVAGSLSRHVKPLPLACALAAGSLAWRCFAKPRASHNAGPEPELSPEEPGMFASEEDFLRHFQAEAEKLRTEATEPTIAQSTPVPAVECAPVPEPLPLRTEEDFLRLFQAEMQNVIAPPPVAQQYSPFALVEEPNPMPEMAAVPMVTSNVLAPEREVAPAQAPMMEPVQEVEIEAGPPRTQGIEQLLAAETPMALEEVMSRNAAWLLGLEPLPVIELDEPAPAATSMPAAIPDSIEIPMIKRAVASGAAVHGAQRSSSHGAMAQLLEREPGPSLEREWAVDSAHTSIPVAKPVTKAEASKLAEPEEAEIVAPAWLQAQMQRDLPNSFPTDVIPKQEPSAPVIVPRRVVPRAPVTVQVEDEAKNWLNWWK